MPSEHDSIADLKRQLESRSFKIRPVRRSPLEQISHDDPKGWKEAVSDPFLSTALLKKLLIVALLFFLIMGGLAFAVFWRGGNVVSSSKVLVKVDGPPSVRSGEQINLLVTITNQNNSDLEFVDLIIEYPPGVKSAEIPAQDLTRERFPLGNLSPGEQYNQSIKAIVFGQQDSTLPVKISTEYRLPNSNAILDTTITHLVKVSASPLALQISVPSEVNSNQEVNLDISLTSSASSDLADLLVMVDYPPGFSFRSAYPSPSRGDAFWRLPVVKPGAKVSLSIAGVLSGQDQDQRSFQVSAGIPNSTGDELAVVYDSVNRIVAIRRAFVDLASLLNTSSASEISINSRESLRGELTWHNNLTTPLTDGEVLLKISGEILDPASVLSHRGFYRSQDSTVVWNQTNVPELARIAPDESGSLAYSFTTLSLISGNNYQIKNPEILIEAIFRGKRVDDKGDIEVVETKLGQKVLVNSVLQLAAKALHFTGPLENRGRLPPQVGQTTSYTIVWSLINSSNDLQDVSVSAVLPSYVKWSGYSTPSNENISFKEAAGGGGEVVWTLGNVRAGIGLNSAPREVAFQIEFSPSASQVGEAPVLIGPVRYSGLDTFTRQTILGELRRSLDTNLTADPQFQINQDLVIQ